MSENAYLKMTPVVALFLYNRPKHSLKVIQSLLKNPLGKLYIFCDGPKNIEDTEACLAVQHEAFRIKHDDKEVIISAKNKGLAKSITTGMKYIFKSHDCAVIIEDDCVVDNTFMDFMTFCLGRYRDYTNVFCVSGYRYPIKIPKNYPFDVFFTSRPSTWGWGTWKDKWLKFKNDLDSELAEMIEEPVKKYEFNRNGPDLFNMLKNQVEGRIDSWGIKWAYALHKHKGLCLYPTHNLVRNIGNDGTGIHCGKTNRYEEKIKKYTRDIQQLRLPKDIKITEYFQTQFNEFFSVSLPKRDREIEKITSKMYGKRILIYGTGAAAVNAYHTFTKFYKDLFNLIGFSDSHEEKME